MAANPGKFKFIKSDKLRRILSKLKVRRNGDILLLDLWIGQVAKKETHDGLAWFFSRDTYGDDWIVGGLTRFEAITTMLKQMLKDGKDG